MPRFWRQAGLTGGGFIVLPNGTFSSDMEFEHMQNGVLIEETDSGSGRYTRIGDSIVLSHTDEFTPNLTGTLAGNELMIIIEGSVFVFTRT